ncbi:MAG: hypothetical protein KF724_06245 [Phycisphaeraceae bacterium]|nr:hypothetical protein [Phycisphaeraceae bacterium]
MTAKSRLSSPRAVIQALACALWMVCTPHSALSEPPSLEEAIGAWIEARAWIDSMEAPVRPSVAPDPGARRAPGGARPEGGAVAEPADHGATAVVIRLRGRVVGTGIDFGPPGDQLRRAVAQALERVLRDDMVHLIPREDRGELGRMLALELEIASAPEPMPGRGLGQITTRYQPALDAIALRRGDRWVWSMPSVAQASNTANDVVRSCVALLQELGVDARDLPARELPESMAFYRAATRRLAQRQPADAPFEVIRGREVIPVSALGPVGRIAFAEAMAQFLSAHVARPSPDAPPETRQLGQLGLRGDYRPHLDFHRTLVAPPRDQGVAAWALALFATMPEASSDARGRSIATARELLTALESVSDVELDPVESPAAVAFALMADELLRGASEQPSPMTDAFRDRLRDALRARLREDAGADGSKAMELAAAALLESRGAGVIPTEELNSLLDSAWAPGEAGAIVGNLPWLLMAERALGAFRNPERGARILDRVAPIRLALLRSQLGVGGPEEGAPDLAGGFALSSATGTYANAQSARPTLALAIMLGEPLLDGDLALDDAMRSQLMALRFLRQLAVDERSSYAFRDRSRVTGGLTESLWDSTQPMAATATALAAVVESERALRAAASRSRPSSGK